MTKTQGFVGAGLLFLAGIGSTLLFRKYPPPPPPPLCAESANDCLEVKIHPDCSVNYEQVNVRIQAVDQIRWCAQYDSQIKYSVSFSAQGKVPGKSPLKASDPINLVPDSHQSKACSTFSTSALSQAPSPPTFQYQVQAVSPNGSLICSSDPMVILK